MNDLSDLWVSECGADGARTEMPVTADRKQPAMSGDVVRRMQDDATLMYQLDVEVTVDDFQDSNDRRLQSAEACLTVDRRKIAEVLAGIQEQVNSQWKRGTARRLDVTRAISKCFKSKESQGLLMCV